MGNYRGKTTVSSFAWFLELLLEAALYYGSLAKTCYSEGYSFFFRTNDDVRLQHD